MFVAKNEPRLEYPVADSFPEPLQVTYASPPKLNSKRRAAEVATARHRPIPLVANRAKISRNGPCPCGASRKFKHCCLPLSKVVQEIHEEPAQKPITG